MRCHPRELHQGLELAIKLDVLTDGGAINLGLQFNIEYVGDWLRRRARGGNQDERKGLSAAIGQVTKSIATSIGNDPRSLPQTYLVTFRKVLGSVKHVLDAESAATMLPALICLRREFGENGGAIGHAFGSANMLFDFGAAFVPLAQCAAGQAGAIKDVFSAIREYVDWVGVDTQRERIWSSLADFEWGTLLADDELSAEEVVAWLASKLAGELSSDDVLSCADAVASAIEDTRTLGRDLSQVILVSVVDKVETRLAGKLNARTTFGLLGLLSCADSEAAKERALGYLERHAREIKESSSELTPEQRSRAFHWAVVEVVERRLIPVETIRQSLSVMDVLRGEVAAICMREGTVEALGDRGLDFTVVAYSLLFGVTDIDARKWLVQQVWQMQEPPMGTLGLCLDVDIWGDLYPELVASLLARANGTRLFETFRMVNNAVHDGRNLEAIVRGDFTWTLAAALQQLDNQSELVSNGAAWVVMQVARKLGEELVNLPIGHAVCVGLRRCAESSSFSVRVAVAFGLAKLAHTSSVVSVRQLASQLVGLAEASEAGGLVNDYSGIVRALVRYGDRVGRVQVVSGANRSLERIV